MSPTDNITRNTSGLTITGTAEDGATVTLFNDISHNGIQDFFEATLGSGIATGGAFSIDLDLGAGFYQITGFQTDLAGNVSANSTSVGILVDTTPLATAATLTPDRIVDAEEVGDLSFYDPPATITISGLDPGTASAVVTFSDGNPLTADVVASLPSTAGSWYVDLSSLDDGPIASSITVFDVAGNGTTSSGSALTLNTSDSLTLTLNAWNSYGATEQAENGAFSSITIRNDRAVLQALMVPAIETLGDQGVTSVDSTQNVMTPSVAQYQAFVAEGIDFANDQIRLLGTGAALATVLGTDLAGNSVYRLDASDNVLALDVTQYNGLGTVTLTGTDKVTLTDSGAALGSLDASAIAALAGKGIDVVDASSPLTLSLAQYNALGAVKLTAADSVTLADSGAALAALATSAMANLDNKGIDFIDVDGPLTAAPLTLSLAQFKSFGLAVVAPEDALTVVGNPTAANTFDFIHQVFTDNDRVVGGTASDSLILSGDYSEDDALAFGANAMSSIQALTVKAGGNYDLTTHDDNVAAGTLFVVSSTALGSGDSFTFDGSAESDGRFRFRGGAGSDSFTGGNGNDSVTGGTGADSLAGGAGADSLAGGTGSDTLTGGAAADRFIYAAASDSAGTTYDSVTDFNALVDKFDFTFSVTALAATRSGSVSAASFNDDLGNAIGNLINTGQAMLFNATGGDLTGRSFLAADANANGLYEGGIDIVIDITGFTGTITTANFT